MIEIDLLFGVVLGVLLAILYQHRRPPKYSITSPRTITHPEQLGSWPHWRILNRQDLGDDYEDYDNTIDLWSLLRRVCDYMYSQQYNSHPPLVVPIRWIELRTDEPEFYGRWVDVPWKEVEDSIKHRRLMTAF